MNWGKGITIGITVFVVATLSVVSYLISLDFYLVNQDYYQDGVEYQNVIDAKDRAKQMDEQVLILFDDTRTAVRIVFPESVHTTAENGLVNLYRPNTPDMDPALDLFFEAGSTHIIPLDGLDKGKWKLDLSWFIDGKHYIIQKDLIL